jgi:V/A-type H+-transporting ATPase subunit C
MDNLQFTHAIARIRVLETRLLDKSKIERMIDSSSAEEALKILGETEYLNYMSNVKKPEDYEVLLSEELKRLYSLLYGISPEKSIIDIMALRYDYHNLKVMLKGKYLGKDLTYLLIPVGTINNNTLKQIFNMENYKELTPLMREALEKAESEYETYKDPQKIDLILDSYMYKEILLKSEKINEKFIEDYIQMSIDLNNIRTLLRAKSQNKPRKFFEKIILDGGTIDKNILIGYESETADSIANKLSYTPYEKIIRLGLEEYSKTNNISYFEKLSENYIMDFIKKAKQVSFGVEPLIGYIIAKETEIKIIRIIMVGKLNNIAPNIIRERLRDAYV